MGWQLRVRAGVVGSAAWFASCGGPTFVVQQYPGPPRATENIAIIRVNGGGPELSWLDGERLRAAPEKGTRMHIEVEPGIHEVGVVAPNVGLSHEVMLRFVAQPGKTYRLVVRSALSDRTTAPGWNAYAYEVDRSTDAELEPAPLAPETRVPAPAVRREPPPSASDAGALDAGPGASDAGVVNVGRGVEGGPR
jgi:hypothetical protein